MDAARDTSQLGADALDALDVLYHHTSDQANPPGEGRSASWSAGKASVRTLVARVADLEAQVVDAVTSVADWREERKLREAAEAQVAALRDTITYCTCPEGADDATCSQCGKPESDDTVGQLRAQVAALTQEREALRVAYAEATWTLTDRAEAAESLLATTRQALEVIVDMGDYTYKPHEFATVARLALAAGDSTTGPPA